MDLAAQVKDTTEAIQNLPPLLNSLSGLFNSPISLIVIIAIAIWLLIKTDFSHIFDLLERKDKKRAEQLDLYVSKPELADDEAVKVLRDLRDAHYFKLATGIYAEKSFRNALIRLHTNLSHLVGWTTIRRTLPYIEVTKDGVVSVRELRFIDKIECGFNHIAAGLSFFAFLAVTFVGANSGISVTFWAFSTILTLFVAAYAFSQNLPFKAAKRIRDELRSIPSQD